MDTSKLGTGQRIAAIAGIVLFIDMWLSWYGISVGNVPGGDLVQGLVAASGVDTTATAWQAFDWVDLVMLATVIAAVGGAALMMSGTQNPLPAPVGSITAGLGALSTLLVAYRILNEPGPDKYLDVKIWAWVGLFAAAGVAYGGWRTMSEAGPAATPPPSAPPAATA